MALTENMLIQSISRLSGVDDEASADTPLFSSGALDSIAMLDLISLVEEQSGVEIRAIDVTLENFDTVDRILRFVGGRLE